MYFYFNLLPASAGYRDCALHLGGALKLWGGSRIHKKSEPPVRDLLSVLLSIQSGRMP